MNGTIELNDIILHAYHGVFEQERQIGGTYRVSLRLTADYSKACASDALTDTIDYAAVVAATSEEMATPSNLIEHVTARIGQRLLHDFPMLLTVEVRLCKQHPPIPGTQIAEACFCQCFSRADNPHKPL